MGNGMNKILPRLYIGSLVDSKDWAQLKRNEITHIISILGKPQPMLQEFTYLCIALPDSPEISIKKHFRECVNFIHFCRMKGGNCLVHCLAGISRSPTIVAAYIMTVTGLSWKQALDAVIVLRPCINPNPGFRRQLEEYGQGTAQELCRHLREKYGENPFSDGIHIQAVLSSGGLHRRRGMESNLQEPLQGPKEHTAAGMNRPVQRPEATPERQSSLQESEQGFKDGAGTRTNQQGPLQEIEDTKGTANLQGLLKRTEEHLGADKLQGHLPNSEMAAAARANQGDLAKNGPEETAGTGTNRKDLLSGSLEGNKLHEPVQRGRRNTQAVLLRLKQNCSCTPRCLK